MPDKSPLPRDSYRVLVIDKAGDRAKTDFFLSSAAAPQNPVFPQLSIDGENISANRMAAKTYISLYTPDYQSLLTMEMKKLSYDISSLEEDMPGQFDSYVMYIQRKNDNAGYYLSSGPYFLKK